MKTIRLIMMFFIICMLGACTAEELAGPEWRTMLLWS